MKHTTCITRVFFETVNQEIAKSPHYFRKKGHKT